MKQATIDKLQKGSSFYGDEFKYVVKKVYKHNDKTNGVQATYSWSNEYGNFCETTYLSREELHADYDDEFVQI